MRKELEKKSKPLSLGLLRPFLRMRNSGAIVPPVATLTRVLIIKPEKLGDMVVILPMVDALRAAAPGVAINLIASPKGVAVVQEDPRFQTIELYRKSVFSDLAMMRRVRKQKYDVTIEMIDDDSSTGLLLSQFCSGAAVRIGANKNRLSDYYDFNTDFHGPPPTHAIDRALDLLTFLGIERQGLSGYAPPFIPTASRSKVDSFLRELEMDAGPLIAINVSAGKITRLWAEEKYVALIAAITSDLPTAHIIIITDPSDRARGDNIIAKLPGPATHVPERWSILDVTALLSRASAVISPDTSIVHLARAFRVPVVGLYPRPQWVVSRWQPYGQEGGAIRSTDDGNIADITPEAVFAAFCEVLAQEGMARK